MEGIIGAIIALVAGLAHLPQYNGMVNDNMQATIDANAALQFQKMLAGANKYVGANLSAYAGTPVGSYVEVPFSNIADAGAVPSGFSQTNVIGQTWHVYVIQPSSGVFQALVEAEGGQVLAAKDMVKIASETGDLGGFVPYNGMLGDLSSADAVGANWSMSLSGLPSPGSGRLVGNISFGNTNSGTIDTNSFLYRVGVPGQSGLNTMAVALGMGGNNINNATTVGAAQGAFSGGVSAAGANVSGAVTAGLGRMGSVAVNNDVSAASAVVSGQVAAGSNVTVASGGCAFNAPGTCFYGDGTNAAVRTNGALYVQNFSGTTTDLNANHANLQAVNFTPDSITVSVGTSCAPNGAIATSSDGTGSLLNCVSGVWSKIGAGGTFSTYSEYLASQGNGGFILAPEYSIRDAGYLECPSGTVDRMAYTTEVVDNYKGMGSSDANLGGEWELHVCTPS
jgi:Bacterial shufflon protein, N-terminal constant region